MTMREEATYYIMNNNKLTELEKKICCHFLDADSNSDIANTMFVAEKTIKHHLTDIYRKLDIKGTKKGLNLFRHLIGWH